MIRGKLKNHC